MGRNTKRKYRATKFALFALVSIIAPSACDIYTCLYPTASITIKNTTADLIKGVYVISQDSSEWGVNRLSSPISGGDEGVVNEITKEVTKIKVVFQNGRIIMKEQIDLTAFEVYVLTVAL